MTTMNGGTTMKYGFGKETDVAQSFLKGGPNLTGEEAS
jgi:hypothetical protein